MKGFLTILGVVLLLAGIFALVNGGFSFTKEETIVDLGPIEATAESKESVPLSPILGVAMVGAGVFLLIRGATGSAEAS